MDDKALRHALMRGHLTADDMLRKTATDKVDEIVAQLKTCRPADEVCDALIDRIGEAPLDDFYILRSAFLKHYPDQ